MKRRTFVAVLGLGTLAGCLERVGLDGGGLSVADARTELTDGGNVLGIVTVENTDSETRSGTLLGQLDFENADVYTQRREVTVPGDRSNTYELEFAIEDPASLQGEPYTFSADIE